MRIDPIKLNDKSNLIRDYRNNDHQIMKYFDYSPFHDYDKRVNDLKERTFKRDELVDVLYTMNDQWGAPQTTFENIDRLKLQDSVVVIGGQQAGLLTGPLYTINKIISIIQFARQQEKRLEIPVIPVFWIAGEDHDFEEINHIFIPKDSKMEKHKISQYINGKYPVSDIELNQTLTHDWIKSIFEQLNETEYTKDLYSTLLKCLQTSDTYVDFFAKLIYQIFHEEGLVLIDSANPSLRRLESEYFKEFINYQPAISTSVYTNLQQLTFDGYQIDLDVTKNDCHLFFHLNNERILLERNSQGKWIGKQEEVIFTTEELIKIAEQNPELLSNNVITRPIMQELLFPTLAFVGGDGEISYWSVLKDAFHVLNINMPPVLPRLSFTYINLKVYKLLESYSISSENVINHGVDKYKGYWLLAQQNPPIHHMAEQLKLAIDHAHQPFRNVAQNIRDDLGEMAEKNLDNIYHEIDYLKNRIITVLEEKYVKELANFDLINNTLFPERSLQERIWNPIHLINEHGISFIKQLLKENCSFEEEHFLVHI